MKALVFGGRSPIALSLCKILSREGFVVHLVTRSIDSGLMSQAQTCGVEYLHELDLAEVDQTLELVSRLDTDEAPLTAVAFLHRYRGEASDELVQYQVEVLTPEAVIKVLARKERSTPCAVLLTSSPAGRIVVSDQPFQYHASKSATNQLVRFGAVTYSRFGLRINALCPGSFVYKDRAARYYEEHPEIAAKVARLVPAGRMASVDEIASVGAFLLSPSSSYVYGQILEVDGGVGLIEAATADL